MIEVVAFQARIGTTKETREDRETLGPHQYLQPTLVKEEFMSVVSLTTYNVSVGHGDTKNNLALNLGPFAPYIDCELQKNGQF